MRRGWLLLFLASGLSSLAGPDWPQFLGPNRDGTCPAGPLPAWPKEGPRQCWQRPVGQGFSGPVVSGQTLILFHRVDDQETVEALETATGKTRWKSQYPTHYRDDFGFDEGPRGTPAIAGDRVFTYGADGLLACWAMDTGARQWSVDTQADFHSGKGFFGRACSPLVESNAVIVIIGGRPAAGIVAFARDTGKVLWKATDDEASYSSPVEASLGGKRRVLALTRGALVVLDPANGRVLFQHPWRPAIQASVTAAVPLVVDDTIFLSASYGTGAALLSWGEAGLKPIWASEEALSNHYASSVAHAGFLYGFDGRQEQGCELRCVELKTGKIKWREEGLKAGTVTLAGKELLVLTERGELLRALASPEGFKPTGRAQILPFVVRAHPAFANGRLYARSKDRLVCVDLAGRP